MLHWAGVANLRALHVTLDAENLRASHVTLALELTIFTLRVSLGRARNPSGVTRYIGLGADKLGVALRLKQSGHYILGLLLRLA